MKDHSHPISAGLHIKLDHVAAAQALFKGAQGVFRVTGPVTPMGHDQGLTAKTVKKRTGFAAAGHGFAFPAA
jgi:hypothetical protein